MSAPLLPPLVEHSSVHSLLAEELVTSRLFVFTFLLAGGQQTARDTRGSRHVDVRQFPGSEPPLVVSSSPVARALTVTSPPHVKPQT